MLTETETANILRLPDAARKKALRLQAASDALYSAARERSRRSNEMRKEIYDHEGWLSSAMRDRSYREDDAAIVGTRAKVDMLKSELAEIDAARGDVEIRRNGVGRLASRVRDAIALPGKSFRISDRQPATLRKGEDVPAAVRRCREKVAELRAKAIEIEAAPFPSSLAKEQAAAQIASLAEAGRPDVSQAILNDGSVEFANSVLWLKEAGAQVGFVETPNAMATLCWMFKDKLIEAVHAEIDRNADDEYALHPDERKSQLAKIASQIEALEYDEVSYIEAAARDGFTIDHRPDISIYALLWLDPRPVPAPVKPAAPYQSRQAIRQPSTPAPVHTASLMPEPALRGSI